MKRSALVCLGLIGGLSVARAESVLHCSYGMYGSPITSVGLKMQDESTPGDSAEVAFTGGRPQSIPVTAVDLAAGEKIHVWLAKDDPNGNIEMIVYQQRQSQGMSKLVNPQSLFAKVLWGDCN